jgi:DNA-binding response OmpR family regulator
MDAPQRYCIQIVDANRFVLTCMGEYLTSAGFHILTATSAEAALRQHRKSEPDLVVLDLDLDGMGGVGFLKHLADEEGNLRHPVLVFSDRADLEGFCREHFRIEGFLPKQAYGRELGEAILAALNRAEKRRLDRVARETPAPPPVAPEKPREVEPAEPAAAPEPEHPTAAATAASGERIALLAEDDETVASRLRQALVTEGFQVVTVEYGPAVLKQAPDIRPEVVVMKQVLPGMNGVSVAGLLVSIPETMHVPVILYDDSGSTRVAQRGTPEGVSVFVPSDDPKMIVAAVRKALSRGKPPAA